MKVSLIVSLFISLCLFTLSPETYACDFCMLGQGISPYLTSNGSGLTFSVSSVVSDHLYDKSTNVDSSGKKESWITYSLTGFYPLTDNFTILMTVPYATKTNIDFDSTSGLNTGTLTSGVGDIALTGRYTLFREHSLESTLIGGALLGIKLPSGSTHSEDLAGNPVDRHALPGTGSFDYQLGFSGSYATGAGFQLTFDTVYNISGKGNWDGRDHQYGNTLNYSLKAFQRVAQTQSGSSFMPFVGVSGESMGKEVGTQSDTGYDAQLMNQSTGGTVLFADVGLYSILSQNTLASISFAKAFYRYMNSNPDFDSDPAENYKIDFSVTYLF